MDLVYSHSQLARRWGASRRKNLRLHCRPSASPARQPLTAPAEAYVANLSQWIVSQATWRTSRSPAPRPSSRSSPEARLRRHRFLARPQQGRANLPLRVQKIAAVQRAATRAATRRAPSRSPAATRTRASTTTLACLNDVPSLTSSTRSRQRPSSPNPFASMRSRWPGPAKARHSVSTACWLATSATRRVMARLTRVYFGTLLRQAPSSSVVARGLARVTPCLVCWRTRSRRIRPMFFRGL